MMAIHRTLASALVVAVSLWMTGCAQALSAKTRHEIGGGIGGVFSDVSGDTPAPPVPFLMDAGPAWTVNYAFRACDRCETFQFVVDIPLMMIASQQIYRSSVPVPDARRDLYFVPNARFSILLFERASLFAAGGGGVGHFTESGRMTTGERNPDVRHSTSPLVGMHVGSEGQLTENFGVRFGMWVVGPRPSLSFPERDLDECGEWCRPTTFSYLFSGVYHF